MDDPSTPRSVPSWFRPPLLWVTGPLAAFLALYCWHLWPEWQHNADLSHGFFTPVVFWLLLRESRLHGTRRWLAESGWLRCGQLVTAGGSVFLVAIAGLLAASVGWSHSLVNFVLAAALVTAMFAGLLCLSSAQVRAVPFNWISVTAIGLWLLSAPLPSGTYARLTLGLQQNVTAGVLNALQILGVPAHQQGNIILLTHTSVGIEEACSGIRSLLSCIYAGFFFAGWQVRGTAGRIFLILAAPALAIGMNFVRSLALTLMANRGMDITGFWHDATGLAILGVTALCLAVLALLLSPAREATLPEISPASPAAMRTAGGFRIFGVGAAVVVALGLVFAFFQRSVSNPAKPVAAVDTLLPAAPAGWEVRTASDLYQFAGILRTSHLAERTYFKAIDGQPCQLTAYVAYWAAGQAPVSLVASHTPDACWPGAGWAPQPAPSPGALVAGGRALPVGEYRFFRSASAYPQYVWFWHVYNGRVISYRDPYSVPALLELAVRYGFQREGEQYFVRLSSNQPWDKLAAEPLVQELLGNFAKVGLAK